MEFQLSREEELIFRELKALSGDLEQLSENLIRHHEQRLHYAEERRKEAEEAKGTDKLIRGIAIMSFNRPSLKGDLQFLIDRLTLLTQYIDGKYYPAHNPNSPGQAIER